ncbi:endolytic transglycosylase MltG [Roseitalea porphyridii]|uniref:Endolytic murein transglycosylase n=1 Tax=Roseitalea porphyridii TaxID=1852022 RepID=A0A4P6V0Y6_9HYPH|nr:endolytic transglycosylase MltG [Roseitalea porphyridii]
MSENTRFGRAKPKPAPQANDPVASGSGGRPIPRSASQALRPQEGVEPPRRRRARAARSQVVIFANFLFTLFVLALVGLGAAMYLGKVRFEQPGPLEASTTYMVRPGATLIQIASGLERRGIISNARLFELGSRAYGTEDDFKAGEFEIRAGASMKDIMDTMVQGVAILHPLTVVEGTTVYQAFQKIAEHEMLSGEMPDEMPPEGMLIADTQKFTRGTERRDIIARMIDQQERLVQQIWEKRDSDLPIDDINEFVTLASIVEKETALAEERPRVAGVFVNRLERGMRLQSDPTIIYGLFGGEGKPADRPIYQSDIESQTPYNTYVIDGLPPGPIAIPGRASLEAVANPARTEELYFVADGTGGHAFARSLDEHNANVRRWRQIEAERAAAREAAEEEVTIDAPSDADGEGETQN